MGAPWLCGWPIRWGRADPFWPSIGTTLLKNLPDRSSIEVVEVPIEDLDLPPASLALIHTRNVLMHMDNADEIIAELAGALRAGGVLLLEEADYFPVAGMTSPALAEVTSALVGKWTWARTIPNTVSRLPVTDIRVSVDTSMLQGGSPEADFWIHTLQAVEHRLTDPQVARENGLPSVTADAFNEAMTLLADDTFWTPLAAVVCVSCRRNETVQTNSTDLPHDWSRATRERRRAATRRDHLTRASPRPKCAWRWWR